jgi:hypothetical protein
VAVSRTQTPTTRLPRGCAARNDGRKNVFLVSSFARENLCESFGGRHAGVSQGTDAISSLATSTRRPTVRP